MFMEIKWNQKLQKVLENRVVLIRINCRIIVHLRVIWNHKNWVVPLLLDPYDSRMSIIYVELNKLSFNSEEKTKLKTRVHKIKKIKSSTE